LIVTNAFYEKPGEPRFLPDHVEALERLVGYP
jgi:hypothetical protein